MDNQELTPESAADASAPESRTLQLDAFIDERNAACIATFVEGFAAGWFFAVPESFKDALDIKQTQLVLDGKTETLSTQGKLYSFNHGDVFYDTREAYADKEWRYVVNKIRLGVQVKRATPSKLIQTKAYKTVSPVPIIEDSAKRPKKYPHQLNYTRYTIDYGSVRFALMTPKGNRLLEDQIFETNHEFFVRFLQTGLLRCTDGTKHDFTTRILARQRPKRAKRSAAPANSAPLLPSFA